MTLGIEGSIIIVEGSQQRVVEEWLLPQPQRQTNRQTAKTRHIEVTVGSSPERDIEVGSGPEKDHSVSRKRNAPRVIQSALHSPVM